MTLFCALGSHKRDPKSNLPVLIRNGKEYGIVFEEFIIWSVLLWKILTYDELFDAYKEQMAEYNASERFGFEQTLKRLQTRGLIATGTGYTGMDALYQLIGSLFLMPVKVSLGDKIIGFFKLTFLRGIPFRLTRHLFDSDYFTCMERAVWDLANQQALSTAELIRCTELGIKDVSDDVKLIHALYECGDGVDYENVVCHARFSDAQLPVLDAVTNLYLKRMVIFDKAI